MIKKKISLKILSFTLISLMLLSGCTENQQTSSSLNETTSNSHDFVSFSAKEKSAENRIYFNYPQFTETVTNADELNDLIFKFVKSALQEACVGEFKGNLKDSPESWEWNNDEYTLQAMNISYEIRRSDSDYFSVTFEGMCNYNTAAHPFNYFKSLTIDLKKGKLVTLSDLYRIDTNFIELVEKKFKEQFPAELAEKRGVPIEEVSEYVEEILSTRDDSSLLEALCEADKNSGNGFYSFLTVADLGISVPLAYAIGNHFEIMISYEDLKQFKN